MRFWIGGLAKALFLVAATLLLAGCGGEGTNNGGSTVPCDDVGFRAQDEELYVTHAVITNTIGGSGDPATVLLDLGRARKALAGYLDAHPPCDKGLLGIAKTERDAIAALDDAIAARKAGADDGELLVRAGDALEKAQSELAASG
jgi:hypothetical protein